MKEKQTVNLVDLEAKYGADLAKEIENHISYCDKCGIDFKLVVIENLSFTSTIAFVTHAFAYLYEVSLLRKTISNQNFVGFNEVIKLVEIMSSLKA